MAEAEAVNMEEFPLPKPTNKRGCTDVPCLILFVAHVVLFVMVVFIPTMINGNGDIKKLYRPRDFRGDYCGVAEQWNDMFEGPNLQNFGSLVYTMNTTDVMGLLAKQLVCSPPVEQAYRGLGPSAEELADYECGCCLRPCSGCNTVVDFGPLEGQDSLSAVTSKMQSMTDELRNGQADPVKLYSKVGTSDGQFAQVFAEVDRSSIGVCVSTCSSPTSAAEVEMRDYMYTPDPDEMWARAWHTLQASSDASVAPVKELMDNRFSLKALPVASCPYDAAHCVPMPGMTFKEVASGWCALEAVADVGLALREMGMGLGFDKLAGEVQAEVGGKWLGDLIVAIDAMVLTAVCSFVVVMIFMVLLRFTLFLVVWLSILCGFILMFGGGTALLVRSNQCKGTSMRDSAAGYAWFVQQSSGVDDAFHSFNGESTVTVDLQQEVLEGDGSGYAGVQAESRGGHLCKAWSSLTGPEADFAARHSADLAGASNYCRNPGGEAITIWCYTTSELHRWEFCNPVGWNPVTGHCPDGYKEPEKWARTVLKVTGSGLLVLSVVYVLVIFCAKKAINVAIKLAQVASVFVFNKPSVVLVCILQAVCSLSWVLTWIGAAALLVCQVPDTAVPTASFATWAEAAGTADTPGACTDAWPTGFVWKTIGDVSLANDECSGFYGDTTGMTPKCWRCGPPRFAFDARFALALFCFLWTLGVISEMGELLVAGTVAWWAFAAKGQNGTPLQKSIKTAMRYHIGSVCFGAFVVALVQFVEAVVWYFTEQAKAQKNVVMAYIGRCLSCCLAAVEKSIKALNRHAFIQLAIHGNRFCQSAMSGMSLIMGNLMRFTASRVLTWAIEWTGKAFVVGFTIFCGYMAVQLLHPDENMSLGPVAASAICGYLVAELFMELYCMTVDTLIHCYTEAENMLSKDDFRKFDQRNLPCKALKKGWSSSGSKSQASLTE